MRWVVGEGAITGSGASGRQVGSFETSGSAGSRRCTGAQWSGLTSGVIRPSPIPRCTSSSKLTALATRSGYRPTGLAGQDRLPARRIVAKVEWHPRELTLGLASSWPIWPSELVVAFYNSVARRSSGSKGKGRDQADPAV